MENNTSPAFGTVANKKKIINDPVWGFLQIPDETTFDLISHPWFQRLRHISQMGMSFLVYPGAVHTRFSHTLGCLYLMQQALQGLSEKGVEIQAGERQAACRAILLHDIGHGPFSHVLERHIASGLGHEDLTSLFMDALNRQMDGKLDTAIAVFRDTYPKKFLHQLVSGQIDVDRLDYLSRDSFHTGVQEGTVGTERIIKMLNVKDDQLVVEEKALYSTEKFVLSRRLMFWQVYLHKTSVCAEQMLVKALQRVRKLLAEGKEVEGSPNLMFFLKQDYQRENFTSRPELLERFALLDDHDVWASLKSWRFHPDRVLAFLSGNLLDRKLFKAEISNTPFDEDYIASKRSLIASKLGFELADMDFLVIEKELTPKTYNPKKEGINILGKDGKVRDITKVSELLDRHFVNKNDLKYFLCYPKI